LVFTVLFSTSFHTELLKRRRVEEEEEEEEKQK